MHWAEICSTGAVHGDGEAGTDLQDGVRGGGGGGGQHQAGLPPRQEDQDQVHKEAMKKYEPIDQFYFQTKGTLSKSNLKDCQFFLSHLVEGHW